MSSAMAAAIAAHQADLSKKRREGKKAKKEEKVAPKAPGATFHTFDAFDAKRSQAEAHGKKRRLGQQGAAPDSDSEGSEPVDEDGMPKVPKVDWSNPPVDLAEPPAGGGEAVGGKDQASFVIHFIRFLLGAWRRLREEGGLSPEAVRERQGGDKEGSAQVLSESVLQTYRSEASLKQTEDALAPLVAQLEHGEVDEDVQRKLFDMSSACALRDYKATNQQYIELTLGKKKWHNAYFGGEAKHNKGFHARRVSRSELNSFDSDPTVQAYVQALRRIMVFAQWVRPNEDSSNSMSM